MNRKSKKESLFVAPIRFYQRYLSPLKPSPTCRFIPCCSDYAATAISRFGPLRGGLMALCRLMRCNPLCKGGVDPVPDHFTLRPFGGVPPQSRPTRPLQGLAQVQSDSDCLETDHLPLEEQ